MNIRVWPYLGGNSSPDRSVPVRIRAWSKFRFSDVLKNRTLLENPETIKNSNDMKNFFDVFLCNFDLKMALKLAKINKIDIFTWYFKQKIIHFRNYTNTKIIKRVHVTSVRLKNVLKVLKLISREYFSSIFKLKLKFHRGGLLIFCVSD